MNDLFLTAILSMGLLAVAFALVLGIAHAKLKVEEDPRVEKLGSILPGVNCGACGYLSCHDFAEHIVNQEEDPAKCKILGAEQKKELHEVMGIEASEESAKALPLVRCAAEEDDKRRIARYEGIATCQAAQQVFGGGIACQYGCMGFGDCVKACRFDAFFMSNGLPRVDEEKCTSCGKCIQACPRGLVELVSKGEEKYFYVSCNNTDDTLRTRKICSVGCIGCRICEKLTGGEFFKVKNFLARETKKYPKEDKKINMARDKCPTKVIREFKGGIRDS